MLFRSASFLTDYYDDNVVSIEGGGDGAEGSGPPPRMEGIDAIRGKHEWWYDNNEVHATAVKVLMLNIGTISL